MSPNPSVDVPSERWLGPYRVLRPLGRGGMGEVVLAVDPRLDRRVAIKRLRADRDADEDPVRVGQRQARFRREARLLAKLRHPAIVQVFELLQVDGEDHLVMEHVDGPNLRQILETDGPLPAEEVVELARRLAEGLDHAHRQGIIHRDLKTENVLIDSDGEPRLADFGLARSDSRLTPADENVTIEGQVLGTVRAMAPEQVLGDSLDARTDLHALGVLIVETLTGRSPFEAPTRQATLARILTQRPCLGDTDAPAELVALVEHLLEKDPALRPRDAGEVAARLTRIEARSEETEVVTEPSALRSPVRSPPPSPAPASTPVRTRRLAIALVSLFLLGGGGAWVASRGLRPPKPLHVAVLETAVRGADAEEAGVLAFAVRSAALRALGGLEQVVALGAAEVDAVARERTPREVARATASDHVLVSEVRCDAAECWLELSRLDGTTGEMLWGASLQAPRAEPGALAWATEEAVASGLPERRRGGQKPMPPELLTELLPLRLATGQEAVNLDPETTLARLDELRQRFGGYLEIDLWRARAAFWAFSRSREQKWIDQAFTVLDEAAQRTPAEVRIGLARADLELSAGRQEEAEATLRSLEGALPGDVRVDELQARLRMAQGNVAEALEKMQGVVARRPSWKRLYNLALMASNVGKIDLAFTTLETLEDRAPGNAPGRRLRAALELSYGDLERAAEIYAMLAAKSPDVAAWTNLGIVHLLRRDAPAALAALEHARELAPENPLVLLNLADAHALGGSAQSATLYALVVKLLENAPETDAQTLTTRAQARARLGEASEAVADVEEAIRHNPESSAVRFEAALVYALVGDLTSARRNRQRALELGLEERWFSLAPFDVLKSKASRSPATETGRR